MSAFTSALGCKADVPPHDRVRALAMTLTMMRTGRDG